MSDTVRDAMISSWRKVCRGLESVNGEIRRVEQHLSTLVEERKTVERQREEFEAFLNNTYPGWMEAQAPAQNIPQEVIDLFEELTDFTGEEINKWWTLPLQTQANTTRTTASSPSTPQELWAKGRKQLVRRAIREMEDS